MAQVEYLVPKIFQWEGGYVNDPVDKGGATNMGVTLGTWKAQGYDKDNDGDIDVEDLKKLTKDDVIGILRKYWNVWKADQIKDQKLANILVDWVWGSGKWGVVIPQRLLGVVADGKVGPKTLDALNKQHGPSFHARIVEARKTFLLGIVREHPKQKRFINGWLNRLNDFKYYETLKPAEIAPEKKECDQGEGPE
jgi:lysozyme family protein